MHIQKAAPFVTLIVLLTVSTLFGCANIEVTQATDGQQAINAAYTAAAQTVQVYTPPSPSPTPRPTQTLDFSTPTFVPPPTATFPVVQKPTLVQQKTKTGPDQSAVMARVATRITFSAYATSSQVRDYIGQGKIHYYVLTVAENQPIILNVDSPNQDVSLAFFDQGGSELLKTSKRLRAWQTLIPESQDYYILVIGGESQELYTLSIDIPARLSIPGTGSVNKDGWTSGGIGNAYVVGVNQGRTLEATLYAAHDGVLHIYGFPDGQIYLPGEDNATLFSMQAPYTQDYIISVVPIKGHDISYNLLVNVK